MNIETHAFNNNKEGLKKLNKHKAAKYLKELYNVEGLDKQKISELYQYFLPTFSKPKNLVEWVSLAKSKDQWKSDIFEMYAENGNLIATDGRRMHIVELSDTDLDNNLKGYVALNGAVMGISENFPEWQKLIPTGEFKEEVDLTQNFEIKKDVKDSYIYINLFGECCIFDLKHWSDAIQNDKKCIISKSVKNGISMAMLTFDDRKAILMPCKKNI